MPLQLLDKPISFGMQSDDVAQVHRALLALGFTVPDAERATRTLGPGTVAVVKALQAQFGLSPTGVVDAPTVRAINAELDKLNTARRVVRGRVRDASGDPAAGLTVQAFLQGPSGETPAGEAVKTEQDGSYTLSYPPPSGGRADLRIQVSTVIIRINGQTIVPLDTMPSGASILTDAGPLEVVNFELSGEANPPRSEFELLLSDLKLRLNGRELAELVEDRERHEVSILAIESGYPPELVASLALAHRLEKESGDSCAPILRASHPGDAREPRGAHCDRSRRASQGIGGVYRAGCCPQ